MTSTTTETSVVLKTDAKGRVLTPAEDRKALMDAFEQSGMSGAAFARLHGIRYSTFAHWRQMRRRRLEAAQAQQPTFQEVTIQAEGTAAHALRVELPGGGSFTLDRADQLPMATALLRYMESR